jgi:hypothetical protein
VRLLAFYGMPSLVASSFLGLCLLVAGGNSQSVVVWKMVPYFMWSLWRERNDKNFDNQERTFRGAQVLFLFFPPLFLDQLLI